MNATEVVELIDVVDDVLKVNKNIMAEALPALERALAAVRTTPQLVAAVGSLTGTPTADLAHYVELAKQFVEVEKKVVGKTDRVTSLLERLKGRPLILRMLAMIL